MKTSDQLKIWFITGVSSGLGQALAEAVMNSGDVVIGTFRQQAQADAFSAANAGKGIGMLLDVTQPMQREAVVRMVLTQFGRVDVLVNNAGFGFAGAVEEASDEEIRDVFETNFFGTIALTQLLLPQFRQQRSGHIIQMSSHGGFKAFAGFGIYNASKFALEGLSEALAGELAPLGIRLTIVEPGPFRTNFAGTAFREAVRQLADYQPTAGLFRNRMKQGNGQQEGDPEKAAEAIIHIARIDNPPLRLPLGRIAIQTISTKLDSVQADLNRWREVAENAILP
ncbi:oxidoreductase [Spirosoma sordidisoli]|uniref:SDR family NAD(P)-dependent oxidoreductase n=1 Tax=Spirosoma sordidisoli TaxID=2502893 RepID=A0A4Q2UUA8_9BACT|nr:oxidoreductase [Spirosoma sordidisoli]RYC71425.1 SDR family NAD(P)-dependent oxidoreductase [Spirosoma sordidisoli]